ncbi:acyltransferase [Methylomonas sp. AM2-LC]|uniref:acyltransferase family protein n=1 Tax=Methylomonas sp. AM2-LC TaxID=3153301 RepID=UPI0032676729
MKLTNFVKGRDNNYNLIRIFAAFAVLVTHSFALAIGSADAEPFRETLGGKTIGSIAVDIFFLTSGFLVTASLLARQSAVEFVWARVLRIFPALLVMLLLTIFALGLYFSTLPIHSYLANPNTYKYFLKCISLFFGVEYNLPGVFESNPYKYAVNGSLWTLPYEVKMYAILAVIWMLFRFTPKFRTKIFKFTIISGAILAGLVIMLLHFEIVTGMTKYDKFLKLFFMFFSGATFFILREHITLSHSVFNVFFVALILSLLNKQIFFVVYMITLPYILFYAAYIPAGFIREYNKLGDYSYGVYIYAFPIQQSIAAIVPNISVLSMLIISSVITLVLAILSWHLLEKNALKLKGVSSTGHCNAFV